MLIGSSGHDVDFPTALMETSSSFLSKLEDDSSLCRHVGLTFVSELKKRGVDKWDEAAAVAKDVFMFATGGNEGTRSGSVS